MDHDRVVEQLLDRGTGVIENILQASDLHSVATASLAIFAQLREVAREVLQAKITPEAQQLKRAAVAPGCPTTQARSSHTRLVSPQALFGQGHIPVRTFQGHGCGASRRPEDRHLGGPEGGDVTGDVRGPYAPVGAELPHRVAHGVWPRCTGGGLSSRGAQGLLESTARDLQRWPAGRQRREAAAVAGASGVGDGVSALRVAIAMDGVMAHSDGGWQEADVGTILGRRLEAQAKAPTLGALGARRYVGVLGSAEDLALRLTPVSREAGREQMPRGERVGEGAPWRWTGADAHCPGGRQRLGDDHLRGHLSGFAPLLSPKNPAGAKARVDQNLGALLMNQVGAVLRALKRMRPWEKALCDARTQLIGAVERNRTRLRGQEPWHPGRAGGAGAVAGARKHVIHRRSKRAGMRWKQPGFRNVLAVRIAHLNGTLQASWASRGLTVEVRG